MKRREFIALMIGGVAWPLVTFAQSRTPLVLVWLGGSDKDPEVQKLHQAVRDTLRELGWADGRNVRVEHRSSTNAEQGAVLLPRRLPHLIRA